MTALTGSSHCTSVGAGPKRTGARRRSTATDLEEPARPQPTQPVATLTGAIGVVKPVQQADQSARPRDSGAARRTVVAQDTTEAVRSDDRRRNPKPPLVPMANSSAHGKRSGLFGSSNDQRSSASRRMCR